MNHRIIVVGDIDIWEPLEEFSVESCTSESKYWAACCDYLPYLVGRRDVFAFSPSTRLVLEEIASLSGRVRCQLRSR